MKIKTLKRWLLICFIILKFGGVVKSQIVFNNGAQIYIGAKTTMQINGGLQNDNAISGPGTWINNGIMNITSNGSTPGNIYISNNAVLQGNGKYNLDKDWINDAVFNANNSTVEMNGNMKELITSNNGTVTTFDTLILKGAGIGVNRRKQLTLDVSVSGALILNDRVLFTAGHTLFIITPHLSAITNDTTYLQEGFVASTGSGSLARVTNSNSPYYYPVGADSIVQRYRKILITPATSNSNTFTVRLANNDASNNADSIGLLDNSLCKVNPYFYHKIDRTSGNDSADIDIFYDSHRDGIWSRIAQWNIPNSNVWNDLVVVTNTSATPYSNILKKKNGNFGNDAFILGASPPTVSVSGKVFICSGESTTLIATGGTSYLWSTGDTTSSIAVNPTSTKKYSISVSNGECASVDTITVAVNPLPIPVVCCDSTIIKGGNVQLITSGGQSYSWAPSNGLSCTNCPDPIATPTLTTTYTVIVTSDSGCSATDSVLINVMCRAVSVCCDSIITHGGNVQLNSSGGVSYSWSPSSGLSCDTCSRPIATPAQTTTYTVTIMDSGCVSVRTVSIEVACGDVFIPNVFNPNEIGHNNILYVRGPCIGSMDFMVFDRWGNKVFESENPNNGWDGTSKGTPMNMGTYIWYLKASLLDGTSIEKKGDVTLMR